MKLPSLSRSARIVVVVVLGVVVPSLVYLFLLRPTQRYEYLLRERAHDLDVLATQITVALQTRLQALERAVTTGDDAHLADAMPALLDGGVVDSVLRGCKVGTCATPSTAGASKGQAICLRTGRSSPAVPWNDKLYQFLDSDTQPISRSDEVYFASTNPRRVSKASLGLEIRRYVGESTLSDYHLFLANDAGRVLAEHGPAVLRILRLPRTPKGSKPPSTGANQSQPVPPPRPSPAGLPNIESLLDVSTDQKVVLGSSEYRLITVPARITTRISEGPCGTQRYNDRWVFGVLIPEAKLNAQARRFSYGSWSTLPLFLLLALLAVPILKASSLSPLQPFTRVDLRLLIAALILLPAVGLSTVAGFAMYSALDLRLDRELYAVSDQLRANFGREIEQARQALDRVKAFAPEEGTKLTVSFIGRDNVADCVSACAQSCKAGSKRSAHSRRRRDCIKGCDKACKGAVDGFAAARDIYPYFDYLAWAHWDGEQVAKWSVERATPLANMRELHPFFSELTRNVVPMTLHTQLSPWTGQPISVLAVPWQRPGSTASDRYGILAMVMSPLSLLKPVMPDGFRFAVIESDGRVVFHPTARRSLYENFFDETNKPALMRAFVFAQRDGMVEATFHGRTYRMLLRRLPYMPWTLITYRDKEIPRSIDLDVLLTWATLIAILTLLWLAIAGILRLTLGRGDTLWLWPARDRTSAYVEIVGIGLLTAGIELYRILRPHVGDRDPWEFSWIALPFLVLTYVGVRLGRYRVGLRRWPAWVMFAGAWFLVLYLSWGAPWGVRSLPMLPAIACLLSIAAPLRWAPPVIQRRWRRWFVGANASVVLAASVLPALLLYRVTFETGMSVLLRHGQLRMAQALANREERIASRYGATRGRILDQGESLLARRLSIEIGNEALQLDIAAKGLWWDGQDPLRPLAPRCEYRGLSDPPQLWLDCSSASAVSIDGVSLIEQAMACMPVYNGESIQTRQLAFHEATPLPLRAESPSSPNASPLSHKPRWRSCDMDGRAQLDLRDNRFGMALESAKAISPDHGVASVRAGAPASALSPITLLRPEGFSWLWIGGGIAVFLGLLYTLLGWFARGVFGISVRAPQVRAPAKVPADQVWARLSTDEKQVAANIAANGLVAPTLRAWRLAHQLAARGVIEFRPEPVLADRELLHLIQTRAVQHELSQLANAAASSAWDLMRALGIIGLISMGVALYFTQRESLTQWAGALSTIVGVAGSIGAIGNLMRQRDGQAK